MSILQWVRRWWCHWFRRKPTVGWAYYLPLGVYLLDKPVELPGNCRLIGSGPGLYPPPNLTLHKTGRLVKNMRIDNGPIEITPTFEAEP